ncbi:MAG: FprA family A-type flavoprotein [Kiritimatiellae bacterium]|nr:FprA family A-type flavoprotein [Kiritimatiellia bacterium]
MKVTNDIKYIGVDDHVTDLFEGQYVIPEGISYNSYIIKDSKIAVMDTVDQKFYFDWIKKMGQEIGDRQPDYLIVQHMEPDHSACIAKFLELCPRTKIVSSQQAFGMMRKYFGTEFEDRRIVIKEGDTLDLGKHKLHFVAAPMVHWPEVIVTYDSTDKVLFSADGFGKFGANDVYDGNWDCEARRYYIGIVGKYGPQVQALLKKASSLDINIICPLHGPVLTENLGHYINKYDIWSSYKVESPGVLIAYTSVYGNTREAVKLLEKELLANGAPKVSVMDLARDDMAEAVEDAFRYGKIVLATTTYNNGIFPFMQTFINTLLEHNFQSRKIAFVENGTWMPVAAKHMKAMLEKAKNIEFAENQVTINASINSISREQIEKLAKELA